MARTRSKGSNNTSKKSNRNSPVATRGRKAKSNQNSSNASTPKSKFVNLKLKGSENDITQEIVSPRPQPILSPPKIDSQPSSPIKRHIEINSSPIKQPIKYSTPPPQDNSLFTPSPRKKKNVAFSDDLLTYVPSSPDKNQTPGRSILKPLSLNIDATIMEMKNLRRVKEEEEQIEISQGLSPSDPNFWTQGTVCSSSSNSEELYNLIIGCITVLSIDEFNKRFEVYATLNHINKLNSKQAVIKYLTSPFPNSPTRKSCIQQLSSIINKDVEKIENKLFNNPEITESPTKNNPFQVRVINQAIRLLNSLLSDSELNNFLPMENISWIYHHACSILTNPKVSKAIVSAYILIFKDFKISSKKKRILIECDNYALAEKMLFTLINMKSFPSATLINERYFCYRNFTDLFPNIMAKNIGHWMPTLLINISNIAPPFYAKVAANAMFSIIEIAKTFLDNKQVSKFIIHFLSSNVPTDIRSILYNGLVEMDTESLNRQNFKVIDVVILRIEELMNDGETKLAMDLWVAITMLISEEVQLDEWKYFDKWVEIPYACFGSTVETQIIGLHSWKIVIYNICKNNLLSIRNGVELINRKNPMDNTALINQFLKSKIKLITFPFTIFESEMSNEVVFALHNLFIGILHLLLNPSVMRQPSKHLYIYWDKIIQPTFFNFYFKNGSIELVNRLGLDILYKLLKLTPINEKGYSELRILSNENIDLQEINSLPTRWIHSKFDRVMQVIISTFKSDLSNEQKINLWNTFMISIKPIMKKEGLKLSACSCDVIDNLPIAMAHLFKNNNIQVRLIHRLIFNLNDVFQPFNRDGESSTNIYLSILKFAIPKLSKIESMEVIRSILIGLNNEKCLIFIADYLKNELATENVIQIFTDSLNKVHLDKSRKSLNLFGEICTFYKSNYQTFVKHVIQQIVTIQDNEELIKCLNQLRIQSWNPEIIEYFLVLVKNAPNRYINQFVINFIKINLLKEELFLHTLSFLIANDFQLELNELLDQIVENALGYKNVLLPTCDIILNYIKMKSKLNEESSFVDKLCVMSQFKLGLNVTVFVDVSKLPMFGEKLKEVSDSISTKSDILIPTAKSNDDDSLESDMQKITRNNTEDVEMKDGDTVKENNSIEEDTLEDKVKNNNMEVAKTFTEENSPENNANGRVEVAKTPSEEDSHEDKQTKNGVEVFKTSNESEQSTVEDNSKTKDSDMITSLDKLRKESSNKPVVNGEQSKEQHEANKDETNVHDVEMNDNDDSGLVSSENESGVVDLTQDSDELIIELTAERIDLVNGDDEIDGRTKKAQVHDIQREEIVIQDRNIVSDAVVDDKSDEEKQEEVSESNEYADTLPDSLNNSKDTNNTSSDRIEINQADENQDKINEIDTQHDTIMADAHDGKDDGRKSVLEDSEMAQSSDKSSNSSNIEINGKDNENINSVPQEIEKTVETQVEVAQSEIIAEKRLSNNGSLIKSKNDIAKRTDLDFNNIENKDLQQDISSIEIDEPKVTNVEIMDSASSQLEQEGSAINNSQIDSSKNIVSDQKVKSKSSKRVKEKRASKRTRSKSKVSVSERLILKNSNNKSNKVEIASSMTDKEDEISELETNSISQDNTNEDSIEDTQDNNKENIPLRRSKRKTVHKDVATTNKKVRTAIDDSSVTIPKSNSLEESSGEINSFKIDNIDNGKAATHIDKNSTEQRRESVLESHTQEINHLELESSDNKSLAITKVDDILPPQSHTPDDAVKETGPSKELIPTNYSKLTVSQLTKLLSEKSDLELSNLLNEDKYEIETQLLQFMVKLRNVK
ncbi:unnamed protein product [Candida verbasci]|uniref:Telomere-associated protein Rif1 N-terminal domain-containing protein n=1 Tax=Candida verbasci TaxID=1227364 RepID=A0A9W4TX16_9ASCO|nr:unnamed protein product [Candida verbasci]